MAEIDVKKLKTDRFNFMKALYEAANGTEMIIKGGFELGEALGLSEQDTHKVVQYLKGENLLKVHTAGPDAISIVHNGIKEVEEALEHPDKPTQHFLPINIIHIGTMSNSTVQQGTVQSNQSVVVNTTVAGELKALAAEIREAVGRLGLIEDQQKDLLAEIDTLSAQLSMSKPKASIVGECVKSIRSILEAATATVVATGFLSRFPIQ
jgi:bacterioferritin-associated ferredoxin